MFLTQFELRTVQSFGKNQNHMNALRNQAQLIGFVGNDPEITEFEGGKRLARFSLATNEMYTNTEGERQVSTQWHTIVAWDKQAEIAEKYVVKGKEIAVSGRILHRTYKDAEGQSRNTTEIRCTDILLLGKAEANIESKVF